MKRIAALAALLAFASPAFGQTATPAGAVKTPAPAPSPETEAIRQFLQGYFSWGEGQVNLVDLTARSVPGYRFLRAVKKFKGREDAGEQIEVALDQSGKLALIGVMFADEERFSSPSPIVTDRDLEGMSKLLKGVFGGVRFRLVLDPSADLPGWKGAKLAVESGYGVYEAPALVTAANGALLMLGRSWDRGRPIPEQRKERMALDGTPSTGENGARVTVVEFSDLQCPSCKRRSADWDALSAKMAGSVKVKRYFKSFPLTQIHSWSFRAASAARCLFEKDPALFLRWKASVYAQQDQLTVDTLDALAVDFALANGVSEEEFRACYLKDGASRRILKDMGEGFGLGVRSTPTYYVDGVQVTWFEDDTMETFLRTKYLGGAGLPLPKPSPAAAKPAAH